MKSSCCCGLWLQQHGLFSWLNKTALRIIHRFSRPNGAQCWFYRNQRKTFFNRKRTFRFNLYTSITGQDESGERNAPVRAEKWNPTSAMQAEARNSHKSCDRVWCFWADDSKRFGDSLLLLPDPGYTGTIWWRGSSTRVVPSRKSDVIPKAGNTSPKAKIRLRRGGTPNHE